MVDAGQAGNQDRRQTTPETPQTGPAASGTSPDASQLGVNRQGLTATEVLERRQHFGENRLPEEKGVSIARLLINQVKSPLVYIILTAAGVSLALREYGDFWIILVVVVIDVILGFFQEYQAQRTYVALKGLLKPTTTVIRDGQRLEIEVWELVPGDLVLLNSGEKVPADGQVLDASRLALDESILTGESEPVVRGSGAPVFMGTTVLTGRATLGVEKTGTATELGQIAASLSQQAEADTPFQIRLKAFSRILTRIVVGFTILILAVGLVLGREFFDMLRTAIILAIAAVPEGLLIAVTVILVLGMRKILARQGLVKKLLAVETLGSVTVICTDKFSTIVAAIEEGRIIFANVRKVVAYTLSNSFAEVLTIFVAMILRWPAPLIVAQILWIHLICDGPSDIVLGFEPKEDGIMDEPPRPLREPILTRLAATLIVVISVASAAFTLFEFNHYYLVHQSIAEGRSVAFASLALNSMVYIFAYRSMRLPLHRMNKLSANPPLIWSVLAGILTILTAFAIPGLRYLLGLVLLAPAEWTTVISFALLMLLIVEAGKAIAIRLDRRRLLHKTST